MTRLSARRFGAVAVMALASLSCRASRSDRMFRRTHPSARRASSARASQSSATGSRVAVVNPDQGSVSFLDPDSLAVLGTTDVGGEPHALVEVTAVEDVDAARGGVPGAGEVVAGRRGYRQGSRARDRLRGPVRPRRVTRRHVGRRLVRVGRHGAAPRPRDVPRRRPCNRDGACIARAPRRGRQAATCTSRTTSAASSTTLRPAERTSPPRSCRSPPRTARRSRR